MPNIKPWYDVVIPHEDIRQGRLSEAVFAANLWAVVQKSAPEMYGESNLEVPDVDVDPEAFFSKTYLTAGLSNVLRKVTRALSEESEGGERIMSLQTSFGGKTHSLVALWHLARHTDVIRSSPACADVRKALGKTLPKKIKGIAVFTNQTCDPVQGRQTPSGARTQTFWGELALQLGGKDLYVDTTRQSTGRLTQTETKPIRKLRIKGFVDLSNWADVFRSFVATAARMNLKRLRLGIDFELEPPDDKPLDANDLAVKAMRESARQLGVSAEEE